MGKKPIVSVTNENERISIKNSLPYLKCVLHLSCVVHGPIYGCSMGFYVNVFFGKPLYIEKAVYIKTVVQKGFLHWFDYGLGNLCTDVSWGKKGNKRYLDHRF